MKLRLLAMLAASIFLLSCSDGDDPNPTDPGPSTIGIVSDDPAIKDNTRDLVVKPGYFYEDITPHDTVLVECRITRDREPVTPKLWTSYSGCWSFPLAGKHKMGLRVRAYVQGGGPIQPTFQETATSVCALRREFTVEPVGDSPVALVGSVIRFKSQWLGELVSPGVRTSSGYEIRVLLNDLTEGRTKLNMKLAENSISGELKLISVKGYPVPSVTPGWVKDETKNDPFAAPIPLVTGHKYEILLRLRLTATSGSTGVYHPNVSFSEIHYFTTGIPDDGFIRLHDLDIDVGIVP